MNDRSSNFITPGGFGVQKPTPPAPPRIHQLAVRFTGSGREYFRIWIVNLLLTLATLSLFRPWAKARALRYFYGHTRVGTEALDFHGNPLQMLWGHLLLMALLLLGVVEAAFLPTAGLIAALALAAIGPALYRASMQFRLANTHWRGMRLRFKGSLAGAYAALLPLFLPGLVVIAGLIPVTDRTDPPLWYGFMVMGVIVATALLFPWLLWRVKKYRHDHSALEHTQTLYRGTRLAFYGVFLKSLVLFLLAGVASWLVATVLVHVLADTVHLARFGWVQSFEGGPAVVKEIAIVLATLLGAVMAIPFIVRPYFVSRMQNVLWSRHGSKAFRFLCHLHCRPLLGLALKNGLLTVLTLGLYWPYAVVSCARLRLQAVIVNTRSDPAVMASELKPRNDDAGLESRGGFFGLNVGL
jgi:uncharacterized membrane protein YjgN (DUF898 family)